MFWEKRKINKHVEKIFTSYTFVLEKFIFIMIFKILRFCSIFKQKFIMNEVRSNEKSDDISVESDSFNLLLNKPEANALRTRHCMKEDCMICRALTNLEESQSSVMLPVQAKDCKELEKDSNV